jgi:hypothetical protein
VKLCDFIAKVRPLVVRAALGGGGGGVSYAEFFCWEAGHSSLLQF